MDTVTQKNMGDELLERVDLLAAALVQLKEMHSRTAALGAEQSELLQRLEQILADGISRISDEYSRQSEKTERKLAQIEKHDRKLAEDVESLSGQILILQTRMENLEFRLVAPIQEVSER